MHQWEVEIFIKTREVKGQVSTQYLLLSELFLPNLTECLVGRVGNWQSFFSLYLFLFPLSLSLSEPRPGSSWAWRYCAGGKLPIRTTLIEQCKQEFYERADLLFITYLLALLFPTFPYFPLAECATLQLPFLVFYSFYFMFTDSLSDDSPWGDIYIYILFYFDSGSKRSQKETLWLDIWLVQNKR